MATCLTTASVQASPSEHQSQVLNPPARGMKARSEGGEGVCGQNSVEQLDNGPRLTLKATEKSWACEGSDCQK